MRKLLIVICLTFVLLSSVSVRGQHKDPGAPKRKFKHSAQFSSVYDKAKDQTTVVMDWYYVKLPNFGEKNYLDLYYSHSFGHQSRVYIKAAFVYPGQLATSPPDAVQFEITMTLHGPSEFKGKEMPELIAFVDGERISLGKTLLLHSRTMVLTQHPIQVSWELLSARFTYQGLLRLSGAKKITMKVGRVELALEDEHVEALRDLASRMAP
jgi:hypothetical protein